MMRLSSKYRYAVIGASNNPTKYGHMVLKNLIGRGIEAIPVNLKEETILNLKVYHKVSEVPGQIDVAVFVIPPEVTEKVLLEIKEAGIKRVWMQPGSQSEKAINICKEIGVEYSYGECIMTTAIPDDIE